MLTETPVSGNENMTSLRVITDVFRDFITWKINSGSSENCGGYKVDEATMKRKYFNSFVNAI